MPSDLFPVDALETVHTAQVAFGELNGDGRPDMFAAPQRAEPAAALRPEGGWRNATDTLPQLDDYSHSAAIGTIRRGQAPDIVVGNGYRGQNGILPYALLNDGTASTHVWYEDGTFTDRRKTLLPRRRRPARPDRRGEPRESCSTRAGSCNC